MAAATRVTTSTTSGYVHPDHGIPGNTTRIYNTSLRKVCHYFSDIDDSSTYASPYGARVVDYALRLTSAGTGSVSESAGTFTFSTSAANQTGYLHIWLSH